MLFLQICFCPNIFILSSGLARQLTLDLLLSFHRSLSLIQFLSVFFLSYFWAISINPYSRLLKLSSVTYIYVCVYMRVCIYQFSSVQSLSHVWLFVTPWIAAHQASLVHHQLPEFTHIHVHQVSDANQSSHPLSSPSPPAPYPSQHQSLLLPYNCTHFTCQQSNARNSPRQASPVCEPWTSRCSSWI